MDTKVSASLKLPMLAPKPRTATEAMEAERVINFSEYRISQTQIINDVEKVQSKLSVETISVMQKQMDKILKNSLFGSMKNNPRPMQMFDKPAYTATMIHVERSEINDMEWRVKIRCPNWEQTGPTFPSESHACEDFASREVKPWIAANCAGQTLHMSYAVFAFTDETDATLCYMRFK